MAHAAIAFADAENLAGSFPTVGALEGGRIYFEAEISGEHCFEGIIGKSTAIRQVIEQVSIVAPTDATVLLHGERQERVKN